MTHDDHNHDPWIAHHFEGPQQQFDAGKLGIWVFLVTEVLFFSGLFCAYVLYRAAQPEVFVDAANYLDKVLGGLNTIVLLFSSLTMAWAVRAAQLNQNKTLIIMLMITMVCAAIFLGVKAVEYSHKWDMGILTRGFYEYHEHEAHGGLSKYLIGMSIPPLILLIGFAAAGAVFQFTGQQKKGQFFFGLTVMMGGYFIGAAAGQLYMSATESSKSSHTEEHHGEHDHDEGEHDPKDGEKDHASLIPDRTPVSLAIQEKSETPKQDDSESQPQGQAGEGDSNSETAETEGGEGSMDAMPIPKPEVLEEQKRRTGIFFSIYYCMTGLHAIHVIAGMIALSWLLWRAIHGHFRTDYFGPVDYVGLYWHLVDLIWIYLFPLLYLIN